MAGRWLEGHATTALADAELAAGDVAAGAATLERALRIFEEIRSTVEDPVSRMQAFRQAQPAFDRLIDLKTSTLPSDAEDVFSFPQDAHGTLCAALVGATADDGSINGAAPECGLMLVALGKTIDSTGMGAALGLCLQHKADVVSCSVGPSKGSWDCLKTVTDAIHDLNVNGRDRLGTLVVWALPNDKMEIAPKSLESYDPLICVAASGEDDVPASDSDYGQGLDLIAPGVGVYTLLADENGSMVSKSDGASVATACAAGVAALVLSFKSTLTYPQLRDVMTKASCDPEVQNKQWDKVVGWGRLNALRAVTAARKVP